MTPFISNVRLRVSDLERSLGFYRDLLGFRVVRDEGPSVGLAAPGSDAETLSLREARGLAVRPRQPRTAGLYHVAWLVPSRPDLGAALRGLSHASYPLSGASDHLVSESLYLDDPDGNGVEIYADKPRDTWQWTDGRVKMAVDPLDLQALWREARPEAASLLAPGTIVGHVHFVTSDLGRSTTFWRDDVGLDVTLEWPMLVGLSHGGYHHHVNLNNWAGPGAPPDDPGVAGLDTVTMNGRVLTP